MGVIQRIRGCKGCAERRKKLVEATRRVTRHLTPQFHANPTAPKPPQPNDKIVF